MSAAKDLLRSPAASAIGLMKATASLLGDFMAWEPESIWLELAHQGVEVPLECRDRLQAAIALRLVPSFYWDATVYEKTAVAFDGVSHPDILEEASPAMLAWAVTEADWIRASHGEEPLRFEHEPVAYTAVVLDRAGFVCAPGPLSFAQASLERRIPPSDLVADVRRRWAATDKSELGEMVLHETKIDVQIARLAAVELHVRTRRARAEAELARLS